jgi:hypothetical protein
MKWVENHYIKKNLLNFKCLVKEITSSITNFFIFDKKNTSIYISQLEKQDRYL